MAVGPVENLRWLLQSSDGGPPYDKFAVGIGLVGSQEGSHTEPEHTTRYVHVHVQTEVVHSCTNTSSHGDDGGVDQYKNEMDRNDRVPGTSNTLNTPHSKGFFLPTGPKLRQKPAGQSIRVGLSTCPNVALGQTCGWFPR